MRRTAHVPRSVHLVRRSASRVLRSVRGVSTAVQQSSSRPESDQEHTRARLHPTDAGAGRCDPAGHGGTRRPRLRADRQRQDRSVSVADPSPPAVQAARAYARAGHRPDARAGGADPGGVQRAVDTHAADWRGGVRRRRHGPAGARVSRRRGHHHRDARTASRSHARALRQLLEPRVPRARRSRPDAGHGVSSGHQAGSSGRSRRNGRRCFSARRCRRRSRR